MMRANMLRAASGAGGISFIGSAAGTAASGNLSVDVSGIDIEADDLAIAFLSSYGSDTDVSISGWVLIGDYRSGITKAVWAKRMVGGETTISTTNGTTLAEACMAVMVFRGVTETGYTITDSNKTNLPPSSFSAGASPTNGQALYIGLGLVHTVSGTWSSIGFPSTWAYPVGVQNVAGTHDTFLVGEYKVGGSALTPEDYTGTIADGTSKVVTITFQKE